VRLRGTLPQLAFNTLTWRADRRELALRSCKKLHTLSESTLVIGRSHHNAFEHFHGLTTNHADELGFPALIGAEQLWLNLR